VVCHPIHLIGAKPFCGEAIACRPRAGFAQAERFNSHDVRGGEQHVAGDLVALAAPTKGLAGTGAELRRDGERAACSVVIGERSPPEGVSGLYLCAFRNKRLFSVDLKSAEVREVVLSLIDKADVVVENFRAGVMDRLGLGYEDVKKRKPDIIYASGTGWGAKGPMLPRESQDLIIQARTGLMAATGTEQGHARPVGSAIVDQHAGALLAMGITAAYVRKLTTGEGTRVEGSLFAAGFDIQTEPLTVYMSVRPGMRVLDRDPHIASWYHHAPYGVYQCKDAEIAVSTNPVAKLAEALDSDELRAVQNLHPYKDRDTIASTFAEALRQRPYAEVTAAFDRHAIWYGPVHDFDDVAEDPQVEAMEIFRPTRINDGTVQLVNHPNRYDGKIPELRVKGLKVGEHTREILAEHGYTPERINDLLARKIVFDAAFVCAGNAQEGTRVPAE
jgi:crotonobetainyl-CoA:carnitine CoA-transferase CaiB-like acyl-CoA transferase